METIITEVANAAGSTARRIRSLRVLVIVDDPQTRLLGLNSLERMGHSAYLLDHGSELRDPFDLILLDLEIPSEAQRDSLKRIREVEEAHGRRVPIVVLTPEGRGPILPEGVDKFVTKPLQAEELERVIDSARRRIEPYLHPGQESDAWNRDPEEIRAAYPMSEVAMGQVVDLFRESCIDRISRIHQALEIRSATEIFKHAHALKGSLGMFATRKTLEVVSNLEDEVKTGRYDRAEEILGKLEHAIDQLQPTLERLASKPEK